MPQLKENLVTLRKAKKLSQAEVADKLFVTPQAVSRWERGETEPDVDTIIKIAEIYGVSVQEVVSGPSNSRLTPKLEKIFHHTYLISSIFLIVVSLIVVSTLFWTKKPLAFFIVFVVLAVLYLLLILAIEITKDILKRKKRGEKKDEK